jgi:hypothetical protein
MLIFMNAIDEPVRSPKGNTVIRIFHLDIKLTHDNSGHGAGINALLSY